jgi:uncharacterized membrane protein
MNIDIVALLKSKIFWANVVGVIVAVAAIFGVAPEMSGKVAEYAAAAISILTIVLRMFSNGQIISSK